MEDDLTQVGSLIEDLIRLYHFNGGSSRSTRALAGNGALEGRSYFVPGVEQM